MSGVHDVSSRCDVFWVSRSGDYDLSTLLGTDRDARKAVAAFGKTGAGWLRADPGSSYGSDVITCDFTKDVDQPVGVFSIAVKPRPSRPYDEVVRPGDLLFIFSSDRSKFTDDPENNTLVTIGLVDSVARGISVDDKGAQIKSVAISGRDLGAVLQDTSTVFDPAFSYVEQFFFDQEYVQRLFSESAAVSPIEVVLTMLRLFYTDATQSKLPQLQWQLYAASGQHASIVSLIDASTFVQAPMFGYDVPDSVGLAQAGNVWTLLTGYTNPLVNEFFFDVRDYTKEEMDVTTLLASRTTSILDRVGDPADVARQLQAVTELAQSKTFAEQSGSPDGRPVPAIVFRQRPYDARAFGLLPVTEIDETEIDDEQTSLTHHDVYNVFRVRSPSVGDGWQEFTYGIRINVDSMFKFGLRQMEAQTRFFFTSSSLAAGSESDSQDFSASFDYYVGLLSTWHAANDQMRSGSLTMRYRPQIRVGTRARVRRGDKAHDYYVKGISHHFNVNPGASRTTLTLVRGVDVDGDTVVNNLFIDEDTGQSAIPSQYNSFGRFAIVNGTTTLQPEGEVAARLLAGTT